MAVFKNLLPSVLVALAVGSQFASADLSSSCQLALAGFAVSVQAECLAPTALAAVAVASGSIVSPVNNWLTQLCPQPACTNTTLQTVASNLTQACATDLQSIGFTSDAVDELPSLVQQFYPTARQVACLADTANGNQLCVTETLTNLQTSVGTLSLSNIMSLVTNIAAGSLPDVPSNVTCTNCTRAAYDVVNGAFPGAISSSTNQSIAAQCGSNYLGSAPPATVSQSANSALASTSSSTSAAAPFRAPAFGIALFSAAAGYAFTLLA